MKWIKQHSDSDFHPQIQLAGFWGARAFELLCRVSGQFDLKGAIPPQHLHPELLAKRLQATDILPLPEAAKAVADGLERMIAAGLASRTEDGGLLLDGWERIQGGNSTPRVQKHRAKKEKETVSSPSARSVKRDETVTSVSGTSGNETVTQETLKKRRDKSREEERDPPLPPQGGGERDDEPPGLELVPPELDPDRLTPERLVEAWNETTGGRIRELEEPRRRALRAAIKRQPDLAWWRKCFAKAAEIRATPQSGWLTLDWILARSPKGWNAERVVEGAFDFRLEQAAGAPKGDASEVYSDAYLAEKYAGL